MPIRAHRFTTILKVFQGDIRRLPPVILFTVASVSIYQFGWGFADPFMSIYLDEFSASYAVIGLFITLSTVMGVVMLVPVGAMLDRVRHSTMIDAAKLCYIFLGLGYFAAAELRSIPLLVAILLVNGATSSIVWAGTAATIRDYSTKKNSALAFGFYVTANRILFMAGLAISIYIVWKFPIHYIFLPVAVFPAFSILISRMAPDDKHEQKVGPALRDVVVKDKVVGRVFKDFKEFNAETWWMYILYFLGYAIIPAGFTFLPLYADSLGLGVIQIGLLLLVMNLPFLLSFISAEIADRSERLRNVIIGFGVSALALVLLSIFHSNAVSLYILAFFVVAGFSIILPSISSVITILTPKKFMGTSSAMIDLMMFAAMIVFPPVIGELIDARGWETAFIVIGLYLGVLVLVTAMLQLFFKRQNLLNHINNPDTNNDPYIV